MIKNFNFYDIYGYFLPGLVLIALIALPFGLAGEKPPEKDIGSAIAALAIAYVIGAVMQTLARTVLNSASTVEIAEKKKLNRMPSSIMLDADDHTFSSQFKARFGQQVASIWGLNLRNELEAKATDEKTIKEADRARAEAFFLCRSALLANKAAGYAEQFEGMYGLMRGITAAFFIAVFFFLGIVGGTYAPDLSPKCIALATVFLWTLVIVLSFLSLLNKFESNKIIPRATGTVLGIACAAVGWFLVTSTARAADLSSQRKAIAIVAVASILLALKCFSAFKFFAQQFAMAIYRDFYALQTLPPKSAKGPSPDASSESENEDAD